MVPVCWLAACGNAHGGRGRSFGRRGWAVPYGEESTQGRFGTHEKDGSTGLHYADQRYYMSARGRFLTADPYRTSSSIMNPGSWNRYTYVVGDPVKYLDPYGLARADFSITVYSYSLVSLSTQGSALPTQAPGGPAQSLLGGSITNDLEKELLFEQTCTLSEVITLECESMPEHMGAGIIPAARLRQVMTTRGIAWWGSAAVLGKIGERIVGSVLNLTKNTAHLRIPGGGYRIPDFIDTVNKLYVEVKAATLNGLTPQLRDLTTAARANGYTVQLWLHRGAEMTEELKLWVSDPRNLVTVQYYDWW